MVKNMQKRLYIIKNQVALPEKPHAATCASSASKWLHVADVALRGFFQKATSNLVKTGLKSQVALRTWKQDPRKKLLAAVASQEFSGSPHVLLTM